MPHEQPLLIELASATDWPGFRQACRVLLAEQVPPDCVRWRWRTDVGDEGASSVHADLFSADARDAATGRAWTPDMLDRLPARVDRRDRAPRADAGLRLSSAQLHTLHNACLHADAGRFELCHRWLHRVRAGACSRGDVLDADWRAIEHMAHAVGREIHKTHAFVRFRRTLPPGGPELHVAWFEPVHHVELAAAPFFVQRFANMHWAILTPRLSLSWNGERLLTAPGARRADAPGPDDGEALWLTYYASTFNPARLKTEAMRREMPRRYWPNLPEAELISPLTQQARARTGRMLSGGSELPDAD